MAEKFANNFATTLGAAITDTVATTITTAVAAPAALQSGEFRVVVGSEIMRVTGGQSTTSWIVERGVEGSTRSTHTNAAAVTHIVTAESLPLASVPETIVAFSSPGDLVVAAGAATLRLPFHATLVNVVATVGTAPTDADILVDVMRNDATVFTTQANRPKILATEKVSAVATPNAPGFSEGDLISVDIDQVGSTVAGADLTVSLYVQRAGSATADPAKWEAFVEPFNALDTTNTWTVTAGTPTVSAGQLHLASTTAGIETQFTKDFLGSEVVVDVQSSGSAYAEGYAMLYLENGTCLLRMQLAEAAVELFMQVRDSGNTVTTLAQPVWNSSTMRYWRIRESAGTIYFDTAPDAATWTNRATKLRSELGHGDGVYGALRLYLISGAWGGSPPVLPDWLIGGINP